jgi:hypothetical protein
MSEQIGRYRCSECGQTFHDAAELSSHVKTHQEAGFGSAPAQKQELAQAYAHADKEFSRARLPIFGIAFSFLLAFAYALVSGAGLFVPLFVASVVGAIVGAMFLFKFFMEG